MARHTALVDTFAAVPLTAARWATAAQMKAAVGTAPGIDSDSLSIAENRLRASPSKSPPDSDWLRLVSAESALCLEALLRYAWVPLSQAARKAVFVPVHRGWVWAEHSTIFHLTCDQDANLQVVADQLEESFISQILRIQQTSLLVGFPHQAFLDFQQQS